MKPLPHHYSVHLADGPVGHATVSVDGAPLLSSAPPLEFDGPGDAWSPEHLLLAAVETCFLFSLQAVARASRLEFTSLALFAEGTVDRQDGVTRFTDIVLRPRLTLSAGTDPERVRRLLAGVERVCLVSASLATPVRLEPQLEWA
jgi:peroxiredoxin-like protein